MVAGLIMANVRLRSLWAQMKGIGSQCYYGDTHYMVNSLAPGRCGCNFDCMILKHRLMTVFWRINCETAIK